MRQKERMHIVITGHVDHGKSTLVGRLLADTNSLPQGKLESIKESCAKNARPFEYSMLLDALEDEQKQGITIDSARIFFKSDSREYVIIDAPGHIEFLRNMLSGASRAAAAVLVIDAKEGVAENSKRHGMLLSLLGIAQVIVVVNKLDMLNYDESAFCAIRDEYLRFLKTLDVKPLAVIPISAREGDNIAKPSSKMKWFLGGTLLEALDSLKNTKDDKEGNFILPLQDVYRFSNENDERRIYAGSVVGGRARLNDKVVFLPSFKEATIAKFESWNAPNSEVIEAGEAVGISLKEDIYVKSGEVMVRKDENPLLKVARKICVNLIWLGNLPLESGREYLFKLGSVKVKAYLAGIERVLHISEDEVNVESKPIKLTKNEAGTIILELKHPVALCTFKENQNLGRFVLVDGFDAAAGGIVLEVLSETLDGQGEIDSALKHISEIKEFEEELFALLRKYFPHRF
ncbi:sulfate adenylyltransferase subunit 1 [Helicobacter turcicus]|uniref:50S ribosome-binding GTPase n=1 Tax=Helicobacter turcicus TaxID=2867412 RepID=A0ABS7JKT8_9HELI|nr:GTP-binding protein [Helicobacter turcicus]MBX7489991.1 50S ribosome-binding GTPase [Helicobacter turcicus]MBX7544850.1 50S ribosome-binding GTPase [Helicobacter turcicus]